MLLMKNKSKSNIINVSFAKKVDICLQKCF